MQQSYIVADATKLIIPSGKRIHALIMIKDAYIRTYPIATETQDVDRIGLLLLLEDLGFECEEQENGDICIVDYIDADKELGSDNPVLLALVGIVPAGSHVTYYDIWGAYNQIRYDEDSLWVVSGTVTFPESPLYPFPTQYSYS